MKAGNAVLTAAEMRAAEQRLIDQGITVGELMRRAGAGAAEWIWRIAAGRPVTVLCGPGNNGGDGYVIAEILRQRGLEVAVVVPLPPQSEAARDACARYKGQTTNSAAGSIFVDCLFGTGLGRPISKPLLKELHKLRETHDYAIALDLPSGVDCDTGALLNENLPAYDLTLALGAWKRAHWLMPGVALMGERRLVPIGIEAPDGEGSLSQKPHFNPPAVAAHKYTRGPVAVIGGKMTGATVLAGEAAMRAGAGYVKLLAEHSHPAAPPDLVIDHGPLAGGLQDDRIRAVLAGPGLGRSDDAKARLQAALASSHPLVLDADALVLLMPADLTGRTAPLVLTPHAGELAKLCSAFEIEVKGKVEQAQALAQATGATILAKGPDNILCDRERLRFFAPPPSWLSTAGTGDVLAGIVASRLANIGDPFRGAEEAIWLHGEAARRCGAAFTASQLAHAIFEAYGAFL